MESLENINELIPNTNLDLLAKQVVEGFITGLHKSPFHGFSVEFSEHRAYQQGENTKAIDWKLYARTDKMYVKRFEEETNLRCQFILDVSSSMYYPQKKWNKIKYSIVAIASLIQLIKKQRDAFGLSTFSEQVDLHTSSKSTTTHQKYIYSELEKCMLMDTNMKRGSIAQCIHELAEKLHRRSMVILFSDMFEQTENLDSLMEAFQHLKYMKHEVIVFHISDTDTEIEFNFEQRPYVFVDMENGEEIKVHANAIRDTYRNSMQSYLKKVSERCLQEKIDFIPINLQKGFNEVLISYLLKRQKFH